MDPTEHRPLVQLVGPEAATAAEAFAAALPVALVPAFEHLVWQLDAGVADQRRAEQQRVDALVRAHLTSGAWYDVLLNHCGGARPECCTHVEQPEQRMVTEAPA